MSFCSTVCVVLVYMCEDIDESDVKKSPHVFECLTNGCTKLLGVSVRTGTLAVHTNVD